MYRRRSSHIPQGSHGVTQMRVSITHVVIIGVFAAGCCFLWLHGPRDDETLLIENSRSVAVRGAEMTSSPTVASAVESVIRDPAASSASENFNISHSPTIQGLALDATGMPLSQVLVEFFRNSQAVSPEIRTETDSTGRFKMRIPELPSLSRIVKSAMTPKLRATAPGYLRATKTVRDEHWWESDLEITIRLKPIKEGCALIFGKVLDEFGNPVNDTFIAIEQGGANPKEPVAYTRTLADGTYWTPSLC